MSRTAKEPPLAVTVPNPTPETTGIAQNDDRPFDFFSGVMKEYWETGHFSDLVISVKGYNVRAHRMVVCSQSTFLNFLVHCLNVKDKKAKTITVPDRMVPNVNAFKAMIGWMYGVDYTPPGDENKTYIHAGMYDLGIRFGVVRLRVYALKRVKQSTEVPDDEFDAEEFLRLVNQELGYPRAHLRLLLTDICCRKIELLLKEPRLDDVFKNHSLFFPRDILRGLGKQKPDVRCLECGWFVNSEGRCNNGFCACEEDWRPYFC